MSAPLWMPQATRRQKHSGGGMVGGGTRRATWHITYDKLNPDKSPGISFGNVVGYLLSKCYEPHIVWDPVTGEIVQCLPANASAYALVHSSYPETNRIGDVHIQIEVYFTPGVHRNGKRYDKITDTPMKNGAELLRYLDQLGIPRDVPIKHAGDRNAYVWVRHSGHYGHFNVPENDHTDPVESIQEILAGLSGIGVPPGKPNKIPAPPKSRKPLKRGATGRRVETVQKRLGLDPDGEFGPVTETAVKHFQRQHDLNDDGVVDDQTWNALFPPKRKGK